MREKEREQEEHEKERVAYAQIDWHDFTVVETIDYQPWEEGEFPAPTTPEEVGARSLLYERMLQEQQQKQAPAAVAAENDDITVEMEIEDDARPDSPRREEPKEMIAPPITSSMPPPILNPAIPGEFFLLNRFKMKTECFRRFLRWWESCNSFGFETFPMAWYLQSTNRILCLTTRFSDNLGKLVLETSQAAKACCRFQRAVLSAE